VITVTGIKAENLITSPNPFSDYLYIRLSDRIIGMIVYQLKLAILMGKSLKVVITMNYLDAGAYALSISNNSLNEKYLIIKI
jgi:hypothetical protein